MACAGSWLVAFGIALLTAGCPAIAFGVVACLPGERDLQALLAQLRQAARLRV